MAFRLRSQSPMLQSKPTSRFDKIQESLRESNKKHPESMVAPKMGSNFEDVDKYGVIKAAGQLLDPTGVSSYGDVKKTWNDGKTDFNDVAETVGALPIIGKLGKLFKAGQSVNKVVKAAQTANKINNVTSKVNKASKIANQEKVAEAIGQSALNQKKTPLLQDKKKSSAYDKVSGKAYEKVYGFEEGIDAALGSPERKAQWDAEAYTFNNKGDDMKADKVRHAAASMHTRQAISKKLGGGIIGNVVGGVGANILGGAHEVASFNSEHGIINGLQEMAMDMTNNAIGSVSRNKNLVSNIEKYGTSGIAEETRKDMIARKKAAAPKQLKSPLQKQKLSAKAAKAKAVRDLAYAKTDDRTAKKALAQRMHRKSPGKKGMDYDHEDGRFESVKQNRGNEGEGTKKESGKNYKVK